MVVKITQAGQPCQHCGTLVIKRTHQKPPQPTKTYYFEWWLACPKCTLYMVEEAKRFFEKPAAAVLHLFEDEKPKPEPVGSDVEDDGSPPWD